MSYANYVLTYDGNTGPGVLNIQGQTGIVPTNVFTSLSGFTFNYGIKNYTGGNSALNNTWQFNCTQGATGLTPASYPSWGFNTALILSGYVTQGNPGTTNTPLWEFNNLPLGTYQLTTLINNVGGGVIQYAAIIDSFTGVKWSTRIITLAGYAGLLTYSNINNVNSPEPSMNISIAHNFNVPTANFIFSLYKLH
jgi:hypothetical protein